MLDEIAVGLAQHKLIPFFGAGVSAGQLRVVWRDVANEMADALALPTEQRENFPEVAEKYLQQFGQLVLVEALAAAIDRFGVRRCKGMAAFDAPELECWRALYNQPGQPV